jgi:hypothetical protein
MPFRGRHAHADTIVLNAPKTGLYVGCNQFQIYTRCRFNAV